MKVRQIFPFVNEISLRENSFLHISFEKVASYFKNFSYFQNYYESFNLTEEYVIAKGFEKCMYTDNEDMSLPVIEFDDYGKVSQKCFPALCELVFNLYPYIIKKFIEDNRLRKTSEGMAELGRHRLLGIPSEDIKIPLIDISSRHDEMFRHFEKIILSKHYAKFQNALLYWRFSYERENFIDSILDLAIAVESLFNVTDEQSLKIPIFVFHFLDRNKNNSLRAVYRLYQLRNQIIHGNVLPEITTDERMEIIDVVAKILYKVLQNEKLPEKEILEKNIYELYHDGL